jgi:hypothetical protein
MKLLLTIALCAVALASSGCAAPSPVASMKSTRSGSSSGLIWVADSARARVLVTDERRGLAGAVDFWTHQSRFGLRPGIADCKPAVWNHKRVLLVTVAPAELVIVSVADRRVLFRADAPEGVLSAEALPDGTIVMVSAASDAKAGSIRLCSAARTVDYPLSARGAAWDKEGKCLWVLTDDAIKRYEYNFDAKNPALAPRESFMLPAKGPLDLYPRAGRHELIVSTRESIWIFTPEDGRFAPFGPVADSKGAWAVGERDLNGRILYTPHGDALLFAHPKGVSQEKNANVFRARWDRLPELTYGF